MSELDHNDKGLSPSVNNKRKEAGAPKSELPSASENVAEPTKVKDNELNNIYSPHELDSLFKGLKKPELIKFSGDKDLYHDWRAQFDVFVDQTKAPVKLKMLLLKSAVTGKPLKIIEKLGYTPVQYKTALEKLDQKFGG